jgi:predicted dehydrogenase
MNTIKRRTFLQSTGIVVAATAVAPGIARAAEDSKLTVGVIGPGGMGSAHLNLLCERKDVEVAYVCDVDARRLATAAKHVESTTAKAPQAVSDMRRIFDDKSVDAVFIATPDHWHAPAAILALDAGKHVYVEKPCCHNIREGRLMVEAVGRSGKCLQVGTQTRSTQTAIEGIERILKGEIGEVLVAKAWNSQRRGSIGKSKPTAPPAHLDFDTWVGPAPLVEYRPNLLHGVWRWWKAFGCGDIGNDGVHDVDVAVWGLGVKTHPSRVACLAGKYFFDDDQEWPDTQYSICEYDLDGKKKQLIFEQRIWSPYVQEGYENGAAFYGTDGLLIMGHTVGWKLYGPRNKLIAEKTGSSDLAAHHANFFDCVRGKQQRLNADVNAGHLSAAICHLSNLALQVGRVLRFDPATEQVLGDSEANALVGRKYRDGHWAVPKGAIA